MQYACTDYQAILARHGLLSSMSRRGNCYDNALASRAFGPGSSGDGLIARRSMEGFFGSLKSELVHRTSFPTKEAARRALFDYIEVFYNRRRRHSGLGYLTPIQAYEQMTKAA